MNPTDNNIQYFSGGTTSATVTVDVSSASSVHQATISAATATAGIATLTACPVGAELFEPVYDSDGVAITYNAATSPAQVTFPLISARLKSFKWSIAGGNGDFDYAFSGVA
jgi:hypothetical protein